MSISKKTLRRSQPGMLDLIDQANMDIEFVKSFLDLLSVVGEAEQIEVVRNHSIVCMCGESRSKMEGIKGLIKRMWNASQKTHPHPSSP